MAIDQQELLKLDFIIDTLSKWRWAIIVPLFCALAAGSYLAITLPKIYEAETLILIQPQKVPTDFVQSIVTSEISDRINTLSQQILSRSNLERIVNEFGLYASPQSTMYMEDKVNDLRTRISVDTRISRHGTNSFVIRFRGRNPEVVMNVTNELANSFINENIRIREAQALGTSEFLDNELQIMRQTLEKSEEAVQQFRQNNMGELPEQLPTNLAFLDRLQNQHNEAQVALRDARMRLVALQQDGGQTLVSSNEDASDEPNPLDIDSLKLELSRLQSRYTDKHPDIIKIKSRINELEQSQAPAATGEPSTPRAYIPRPVLEVQNEIRVYESDIKKIKDQISLYEKRVEATPKREQELLVLQRDYSNLQEAYQGLLNRRIEAEISVNMERKQKGEQFRILDRARLPKRPVAPDMRKVFILTMGAGLGIGGAIIFLFEFMKKIFRSPKEIENLLGLPTLAMITTIEDRKLKIMRWVNSGATLISLGLTVATLAFFTSLTLMGVESTLKLVSKLKDSII